MTVSRSGPELKLESILFATDFSSASDKAGLYVTAIARQYGSKIHLVHVLDLSAAFKTLYAGTCIDLFRRSGEDKLAITKSQFASAGIQAETILREALEPAEEILEVAKEMAVDLIVSGTRGHKGVARVVLGSVTEQLIHHAECPVLTVGPHVEPSRSTGKFQRIVCATDFSVEAATGSRFALSFAQTHGAHMFLCHVLPRPDGSHPIDGQELNEKFGAELRRQIPDIAREWCEPECIVDHGYAADGILLLAHRVKADLIVLGARRSSHWFANLKAGIAIEVIRAASCPVLTIRG